MALTAETYLTSKQVRTPFHLSESGLRAAVARGDFPAPVAIGSKRLWPKSRVDAFERHLLDTAARREAEARGEVQPSTFEAKAQLITEAVRTVALPRKVGRPRGSKNKPKL